MAKAMLIDMTRCVGCMSCYEACCEINDLPKGNGDTLNATAYTAIREIKGVNVRSVCMHCENPACASVCPVGALRKTVEGPVVYDAELCMGCRYCMMACPFGVPKYEWDKPLPRVQKCIMCYEKRVSQGKQPACTEACPAEASIFGEREELLTLARTRMQENPDNYYDYVYGEREVGGTSVLYLSPVSFKQLGFRTDLQKDPLPLLTWRVLSLVPEFAVTWGILLGGIWWITNRREKVKELEGPEIFEHPVQEKKEVKSASKWKTLIAPLFSEEK